MFRLVSSASFPLIVLLFTVCVHADVITIEGTIKSVDAKKRTITVETGSKTLTLDVSSKAKISVEGKEASLDTLKPGQKVEVSYHDKLEIVLKIEGDASESPIGGDKMISLFDGKTLAGWKALDGDEVKGWAVENGELKTTSGDGTALLLTDDKFDDFEFQCDFWLDNKANSGVFLRGRYEVQLVDDGSYPKFGPNQRCGAIYGQVSPRRFAYHGPRRWNSLSVRLERKTVTVVLNGVTVIDHRYIPKVTPAAVDDREDQPGAIGLQKHTSAVKFRDLKIRRLDRQAEVTPNPIIGDFDITWKGDRHKKTGKALLSFSAEHEMRKDGTLMGRWEADGDQIRITFADKNRGYALVHLIGKDRLQGTQYWAGGARGFWEGRRKE